MFSGKEKWKLELEINISGWKWQQPFDGDLQKAAVKKIIIWKKVQMVMDKYEQILMNKASWKFDETKRDHFFEKSSSMNALIVAKSNVKLETRLLWNKSGTLQYNRCTEYNILSGL